MTPEETQSLMAWAEAVTAKTADLIAQVDALAAKTRNLAKRVKTLEGLADDDGK